MTEATNPRDLEPDWDVPARHWSERLWEPPTEPHFEPAFRRALAAELEERADADVEPLLSAIEQSGSVITAHHVCPTNGPTFGAMDYLATIGRKGPVLVLAWSGVPMSNAASSGALCFGAASYESLLRPSSAELQLQLKASKSRAVDGVTERRLVLIPPELRDALVYECALPARLSEVLSSATPRLRQVVRSPSATETYAGWALAVNESLARSVWARSDLWYVDLNRVARRYLLDVLADPRHVMNDWLQSDAPGLRRWPWFYACSEHKGRPRITPLSSKPERLLERLHSGELCPGLMPVFCALRSLSRIRLLGGVRQVAYLEEMASTLRENGLVARDAGVPGALLTGRLTRADGTPLYPFDVAVGAVGRDELPNERTTMGALWRPLLASFKANLPAAH